jgi:CRISPR/Cas system-associated exonuclease Cas4 (RecB family)
MEPFLKLVAKDIFNRFGETMHDITIVFPNRRSILYFNKYLSQIVNKPVWAPQCVTISAYIQSFSELQKADDLLLLFDLYAVYCKIRNSNETFDNFYYWGELMLSDFDDIDKYLVDAQNLFQNLSALKNINEQFSYLDDQQIEAIQQFWKNFDQSKSSKHREGFSDLWQSMFIIYSEFRNVLLTKKLAYEGMIYREVSELINQSKFPDINSTKVIFVGFNALNECEKNIFRHVNTLNKALFYWDYDLEYSENKIHEAGFFIRNNLTEFPSALTKDNFNNFNTSKNISTLAIPSNVGQAKVVHQILSRSNMVIEDPENTAILLTDENLLIPVLHSIPDNIPDINITMGYLVQNSNIVALIESVGILQTQARVQNENESLYYHKHISSVCSHPVIMKLAPEMLMFYENVVVPNNLIYIVKNKIPNSDLNKFIFRNNISATEFVNNLAEFIKYIGQHTIIEINENTIQRNEIELETLKVLFAAINRTADLLNQSTINVDIKLAFRILLKIIKSYKVPFEGEPLKGLQVMGFLESRSLDFENVIIIGVNEGNLPKTNVPASFIPYNLRYGFGLPTLEFRDAMYAYYFYRVLERAKNISLVYNTRADEMGASEVSRYITQLQYNGKFNVQQKVQTFNIISSKANEILINKDADIFKKLGKYIDGNENKSYLSPSAISNYIDCSLRFYFHYIAGIKEFEQPFEEIDPAVLGNILHSAMQELYNPYIDNYVDINILKKIIDDEIIIDTALKNAIAKLYFRNNKNFENIEIKGRNMIIYRILQKYIRQIIYLDIENAPFKIIALEKNISIITDIISKNNKYNIRIGGNIDRVDSTNNYIRIIDYKTGMVDTKFSTIDELFISPEKLKAKKEIFQSLFYSLIYKNLNQPELPVQPNIYGLRKIFSDDFDSRIYFQKEPINNIDEIALNFSDNLKIILSEIYNTDWPFRQTEDVSKCKNCVYKTICHRAE